MTKYHVIVSKRKFPLPRKYFWEGDIIAEDELELTKKIETLPVKRQTYDIDHWEVKE